jgi:hypothetical protein
MKVILTFIHVFIEIINNAISSTRRYMNGLFPFFVSKKEVKENISPLTQKAGQM